MFFCVPGDRELNPIKAGWAVPGVELLEEADFASFGIPKGSLGPVDPPAGTLVDRRPRLEGDVAWGVGANENDYHLIFAQPGRDFEVDAVGGPGARAARRRLSRVRRSAAGRARHRGEPGLPARHEVLRVDGRDVRRRERRRAAVHHGLLRRRVSRSSLAAVIEQHNDEAGIIWPVSVAPLEVAVLPLMADGEVAEVAERSGSELADAGIETVIDDRDERAGVKFDDADLVGWPFQVVVGKRGLAEGVVELKTRATGERDRCRSTRPSRDRGRPGATRSQARSSARRARRRTEPRRARRHRVFVPRA